MPPGQISNSVRQNQLRTLSMPQLNPEGNSGKDENKEAAFQNKHIGNSALLGPPKPPRTNIGGAAFFPQRPLESGKTDKTEIRAALQNWQLGLMSEDKMGYRNLMNRNVPVTENNKGWCIFSHYPVSPSGCLFTLNHEMRSNIVLRAML